MAIYFKDEIVEIYTQPLQWSEFEAYKTAVRENMVQNSLFGFTGSLCYSNHHDYYDAWQLASRQVLLVKNKPLVAVNPAYLHPYTIAKSIDTLQDFLGKSIAVNFITGTALSELNQIGDRLSKQQRYKRLDEFMSILNLYFSSDGEAFDFDGNYYQLERTTFKKISPFTPDYFLAGTSLEAKKLVEKHQTIAAIPLQKEHLTEELCLTRKAVFLGLHLAENYQIGQEELREILKIDKSTETLFRIKMSNTDSQWRRDEWENQQAEQLYGLWQYGIKTQVNAPFLMGDIHTVAAHFSALLNKNCRHFIISLPQVQSYKMLFDVLISSGCYYA